MCNKSCNEFVVHCIAVNLIISMFVMFKFYRSCYHCWNVYRGTDEHFGISDKIDIVNSTLGKALGGAAGKTELQVFHFYLLLCSVQCQYILYSEFIYIYDITNCL